MGYKNPFSINALLTIKLLSTCHDYVVSDFIQVKDRSVDLDGVRV